MSTSTMLRPMGSTAKPMKTATTSSTGARKCTARIGAQRNNVFLGQRLDAVGDRLQNAERPHAIRPEAILHAPQPLALQDRRSAQTAPGKRQTMATTPSSTPATGCNAAGRKPTSQCWRRTKIWSIVSIMG